MSVFVAEELSEVLNTKVVIGRINMGLLNRIIIDDVLLDDQSGQEMLKVTRLSAKFDIMPFFKGKISISSVQLFGFNINLRKETPDFPPNFKFVLDAFASKDTVKKENSLDLRINSILIRRGRMSYHVLSEEETPGKFNAKHIQLQNIIANISLKALSKDSLNLGIKRLSLDEKASGFSLKKMSLKLVANNKQTNIDNFTIELPETSLKLDTIHLEYDSLKAFDRFTEQVHFSFRTLPSNETGHPTRSYQLIHQNPYTLIGYEAYDWADPVSFLKTQAFITGELAETLRRSNDQASGIMHFALMTWFRQTYDYQNIEPYPTYYALKRALQPVLVSAELWGRNLYAGEKLPTRIYIVNDREDGTDLKPSLLHWEIQDETGKCLASGCEKVPAVKHYARHYIEPNIQLPNTLPANKTKTKLVLKLTENGLPISANEYELLLARKEWNAGQVNNSKKIVLLDKDNTKAVFDFLNIKYQPVSSVKELLDSKLKADLCVISGLTTCNDEEKDLLRAYQSKGGKLLFLNNKETAKTVYPEYITGWIIPTEGDIVIMERNDAPVFNDIDVLELRYFNNNKREIPMACTATLKAHRHKNVTELAGQMKIHAYIDGGKPEDRIERIESMRGLTMLQIADGKGVAIISTMCTEKAITDPIAGKLVVNMINYLTSNK